MAQTLTFKECVTLGMWVGATAVITAQAEQQATSASTINITSPEVKPHPISLLLGKYRDEPLWDGFEAALRSIHENETTS